MLQLKEMVYAQGEATKEENETISINASQAQSSMGKTSNSPCHAF